MGPRRRRGTCASLSEVGPKDMQAGPRRRRGARASLLDDKQREFTVSSFGPVARAGRTSQACRDMLACPCVAQGARGSLPACGPTDTPAGPPRRGARASLRGCIAVNNQCFKLRAEGSQSAAAEHLSERHRTRNGQEVRLGVWQERRIWTSQVIITQWAGILGQGTGASSTVWPYRRRRSEEANLRRATLDKGGGARP